MPTVSSPSRRLRDKLQPGSRNPEKLGFRLESNQLGLKRPFRIVSILIGWVDFLCFTLLIQRPLLDHLTKIRLGLWQDGAAHG